MNGSPECSVQKSAIASIFSLSAKFKEKSFLKGGGGSFLLRGSGRYR
jgi:hypothetical protein